MLPTAHKPPLLPLSTDLPKLFSETAAELGAVRGTESRQIADLLAEFRRFLSIYEQLNRTDGFGNPGISRHEITELGEYGLMLLYQLAEITEQLELAESQQRVERLILGITDWVIKKSGKISRLEPVVNALAAISNRSSDLQRLEQLARFMGRVSTACADAIQHDLDPGDPNRPWRLLQVNRGIVATRSHNPELITAVYEDLITSIPYDAPAFFREGVREIEKQDYPDHVRSIVQEYHERFPNPLSH